MNSRARRDGVTVLGVIVAAAGLMFAFGSADAASAAKYRGKFEVLPAAEALQYNKITGSAKMEVGPDSTYVVIEVEGLDADHVYKSHLHDQPCALGGGGHYQDIVGGSVDAVNELWPASEGQDPGIVVRTNGNPKVSASATNGWAARTNSGVEDAMSVVIHDAEAGNAKIACADLAPPVLRSR